MDTLDLKILDIVQRDNKLAAERVAERVGLSPSAVQRRLKRLRDEGVIEADVSVVSPEAVGRGLTAIVEVTLQQERPLSAPMNAFKKMMLDAPEVMQCYHVTGEADFIVVVTAKDVREYEALTRRFFVDNPNVRRYRTSIVVNRVKAGLALPLTTEEF